MLYTFDVGNVVDRWVQGVDCCPWTSHAGASTARRHRQSGAPRSSLYTEEQRRRRDSSKWTLVQGVLAPLQFAVFLVSLGLVLRYLATGEGLAVATGSIVVKTLILYTIMLTGSLWERDVFGRYLFARAFFWEDVVSMLVLALHTAYLVSLVTGSLDVRDQLTLALAAYAAYVVNATQFLLKLQMARREQRPQVARPDRGAGLAGLAK